MMIPPAVRFLGVVWILSYQNDVIDVSNNHELALFSSTILFFVKTSSLGSGTVAHTFNPNTLGGRDWWIMRPTDRDHPGQHGETPSLLKIQNISWAWWPVPVIPATQEAEAELAEPRRWRLRWAEIAPWHSRLGNKSKTTSQKKRRRRRDEC